MAKINSKPKCAYCKEREALGVFRNKWICGECLVKFERKIRQAQDNFLDIIEKEVKDGN